MGVVNFCLFFFLIFFSVRSVHNVWTENWGTNRIQHAQEQLSPKDLEGFDVPLSSMVTVVRSPPNHDLSNESRFPRPGDMDAADLREISFFFCLMQMFDIADDGYWIKWMKLILLYFTICWSLLIFVVMIGYWFNCCSWAWWGYSVVVFSDFCDYRRCQTECSPINLYILNREPAPRLWILWSRLNIYFLVCVFSNGSC